MDWERKRARGGRPSNLHFATLEFRMRSRLGSFRGKAGLRMHVQDVNFLMSFGESGETPTSEGHDGIPIRLKLSLYKPFTLDQNEDETIHPIEFIFYHP